MQQYQQHQRIHIYNNNKREAAETAGRNGKLTAARVLSVSSKNEDLKNEKKEEMC